MTFILAHGLVLILLFFRADYECFQIELSKNYGMTEWREDIKKIMLKAGLQSLPITFLFTDTQVIRSIGKVGKKNLAFCYAF